MTLAMAVAHPLTMLAMFFQQITPPTSIPMGSDGPPLHPHSNAAIIIAVVLTWLFFFAGEALHIWLRASLVVNSGLNAIRTYGMWFRVKGPVVAGRIFLETCLFMVFEYGSVAWFPSLLPRGGSVAVKIGVAGFIGYGADSLLDQAFAKLGLDKELPPGLGTETKLPEQADAAAAGKP